MKKVTIIAPVYNESEVISDFHTLLNNIISPLRQRYYFEIMYVVDKSSDGTLEILKKIYAKNQNVRLIVLSRRFGHQMSLVAGMDHADGDAVIMMDCDLEHPPEVIPRLLEKFEDGFDVVNTRRIYNRKVSFFKRVASKLFYRIINRIAYIDINEDAADFRLISKKVLRIFQNNIREQNQFLRFLFPWCGFNQTTVAFVSENRKKGRSKYNFWKLISFAIIGTISFSKTPLKISIIAGLTLSALSIIYGFYSLFFFIIHTKLPQGWTSLVTLVTFIGGVQLIVLGIIGEYIGSIFDEVKKRPLYIIEEEYPQRQA